MISPRIAITVGKEIPFPLLSRLANAGIACLILSEGERLPEQQLQAQLQPAVFKRENLGLLRTGQCGEHQEFISSLPLVIDCTSGQLLSQIQSQLNSEAVSILYNSKENAEGFQLNYQAWTPTFDLAELTLIDQPQASLVQDFCRRYLGFQIIETQASENSLIAQYFASHIQFAFNLFEEGHPYELIDALTGPLWGARQGWLGCADRLGPQGLKLLFQKAQLDLPSFIQNLDSRDGRLGLFRPTLRGPQFFRPQTQKFEAADANLFQKLSPIINTPTSASRVLNALQSDHEWIPLITKLIKFISEKGQSLQKQLVHKGDFDTLYSSLFEWEEGPVSWGTRNASQHDLALTCAALEKQDRPLSPRHQIKEDSKVLSEGDVCNTRLTSEQIALIEWNSPLISLGLLEELLNSIKTAYLSGAKGIVLSCKSAHATGLSEPREWIHCLQQNKPDALKQLFEQRQIAFRAIKEFPLPIVLSAQGALTGTGLELALHTDAIVTHVHCKIGLDDARWGLTPHSGAYTRLLLRSLKENKHQDHTTWLRFFQLALQGSISRHSYEAQQHGWIPESTTILHSRDDLIHASKHTCLSLFHSGYTAELKDTGLLLPPESCKNALAVAIDRLEKSGQIDTFQFEFAKDLSRLIGGGSLSGGTQVPESYTYQLELESVLNRFSKKDVQAHIKRQLSGGASA